MSKKHIDATKGKLIITVQGENGLTEAQVSAEIPISDLNDKEKLKKIPRRT
jgi:hypothetical protein